MRCFFRWINKWKSLGCHKQQQFVCEFPLDVHLLRWEIVWRVTPRIWRNLGSALPFQTRLTQTNPVLPLSNEHGSRVKDQGRRQCCHNKHKKFPYQPTRDVSLLSRQASYNTLCMCFIYLLFLLCELWSLAQSRVHWQTSCMIIENSKMKLNLPEYITSSGEWVKCIWSSLHQTCSFIFTNSSLIVWILKLNLCHWKCWD